MPEAPRNGQVIARPEVWAWAVYDWANSAYSTVSITVLVKYVIFVLDQRQTDLGALVWSLGIGLTMFTSAILSPILGAMADAQASKRKWLGATALGGAATTCLMFFATPDRPWLLVALFITANLLFEISFGFYNAFLPEIADEETMGQVSAWGYALGYLGGGLALALVLALIMSGYHVGLPHPKSDPAALLPRLGLLVAGLWWGVFTIPILVVLRDRTPPRKGSLNFTAAARGAVAEVTATLRNVRKFRTLALFLLAFLVYNDGVQTVISQASVFADKVLQMPTEELIQVILMIQFVAMIGSWITGWLANRIGQKITLQICLSVWIVILIAAWFVTTSFHFWLVAIAVALVLGGTQSVSRAIMGLMTPARRTAEFFGFFNFSGKATSIFGPNFFGAILYWTGKPHWALVSLLIFFVAGWFVLLSVDVARGTADARADDLAAEESR